MRIVIIFLFWSIFLLSSCNSSDVESNPIELGFKGFELLNNFETVNAKIPNLIAAPENVSKKRGEGFKEFYSMQEPSFNIEEIQFNPSSFYVFNKEDELVSFYVYYVCVVEKEKFNQEEIIRRLNNNQIKGLTELSEKENMKLEITNEIMKQITIDMESTEYPVLKYEVTFLP